MDALIGRLEIEGPLTGKDLVRETGLDVFEAWKKCLTTDEVMIRVIGKRYLRLDRKVDGYARLSPSIMREFLNYTVIGLGKDRDEIELQAERLQNEIHEISKKKLRLARETIRRLVDKHPRRDLIIERTVFIIAGDVVLDMAHCEPRPELSTGELVRGSDLDIIVVADNLDEAVLKDLDRLLYQEKYNILINPVLREELDYIIKDLDTVNEQLRFNNFKAMVASKILHEGRYLYGSQALYSRIKQMLFEQGINLKIAFLEERARQNRRMAEHALISAPGSAGDKELMSLFYTTEEKEEIF